MNYYLLSQKDQPQLSWAIFVLSKTFPKHHRNPEIPEVIYRFFGPQPEGEMQMKPQYVALRCKACGQYDDDDVFEVGFNDPVTIRIKSDFNYTQDRVFAISDPPFLSS